MTQPTPPTQPPDDDDTRDEDHAIPGDVLERVTADAEADADAPGLQATWADEITEAVR